ncbi:hypothetical protein GMDG_07634 [Pseudogymnoascus destructans 20631-21]|uniref:Uncharacterized protein n=1 Tax=Pseudogymnoascus destructans (strain ATCC MYA-4855 / 20631-21) TaxID=658429 RepID=L8G1L5_PSED2|nr:hypothetical protein GMDG_07634 [Pseudogymnoascus destructans 20631-21]
MAPHKKVPTAPVPAVTTRKRTAAQMLGSPRSKALVTPTPSRSVSSQRPCAIRPYRSPTVEDGPEEVDDPRSSTNIPKEMRTVLGWKVAARCVVPESAGRLRAGPRPCCVKCARTYFNFPGQLCWIPGDLGKCGDCLQGNHQCVPANTHSASN